MIGWKLNMVVRYPRGQEHYYRMAGFVMDANYRPNEWTKAECYIPDHTPPTIHHMDNGEVYAACGIHGTHRIIDLQKFVYDTNRFVQNLDPDMFSVLTLVEVRGEALVGKWGFCAEEAMIHGIVYPPTDLLGSEMLSAMTTDRKQIIQERLGFGLIYFDDAERIVKEYRNDPSNWLVAETGESDELR